MPKDVEIAPGQTFHLPAAQQANVDNLLKILNKKEATDALKGLGEIDTESWVNMNSTVSTLKEIIDLGGASVVVGDIKEHIKQVLLDNINEAIAPLKNELSAIITDHLVPIYNILNDVTQDLIPFLNDYKTGAFTGALVGSIWGEGTMILGGIMGAALEAFFRFIFWDLWWDHWPRMMTDMVTFFKEWWKEATAGVGDFWEDFWGGIGETVSGWFW